ncbi:MAG: AMP-binding protein, partial [Byssovorax sp.]
GIAHSGAEHPARFFRVSKRVWAEDHRAEPAADPSEETVVHLSCGPPLDGCAIRIVDADGRPLPPRHAGRMLLRSTYLFTGYYRRDDLDGDLFDAEGFLDTGDVGYLDEDGHVYVTGRIKELVKVGGRTVYPQDVEDVLNTLPGIHPGRAVCFGVTLAARGTEGLVILAESDLPEAEWPALVSRVRVAVVKAADVDVLDTRIVARNSLRKSTAGKLARDGNRAWYLEAKFGAPAPAAVPRSA